METRRFGTTDLQVSVIGFGGWGIGGAAMAGSTPIGWGRSDDRTSLAALRRAFDLGINFYDTADFYGLGKSEELVGRAFGNSDRVVVATKVGHRIGSAGGGVSVDYSARHIREACAASLRRLRRDHIDYYQLHSARLEHLEAGECIEEMERLRESGKVRYWGISLNTFRPEPEADFFLDRESGSGFQLVLNVLNRRALPVVERARAAGMGVIVRMPLQFGLLTGAVHRGQTFPPDDHRSFRLDEEIIGRTLDLLDPFWREVEALGLTPTQAALSYAAAVPGVSTIIPGIRTPEQAELNAAGVTPLSGRVKVLADALPANACAEIMRLMEAKG
jgi:aryl-alcohol dehydrogenase-like predicted oxidoreductase